MLFGNTSSMSISNLVLYPCSVFGGKIFVLGSIRFNQKSIDSRFLQGNHVDPLSILPYKITLAPLQEDLWAADLGLIAHFYVDDEAFYGLVRRSAQILKLLLVSGTYQG